MGKGERATVYAIDHSREELPYAMVGLDSDGGSEFINWHLHRYAKKHKLNFTRSRPGQSNDNAHIEQKNKVAVRRIVGHGRYDTPEQLILLQELYRGPWRMYFNFFLPTRKVTSRRHDKQTGKARYMYDAARTPYQRVLDHPSIREAAKRQLMQEYATLNPIDLLENIHRLESKLMAMTQTDGEFDEILK
jgi:transposase InsO family protein